MTFQIIHFSHQGTLIPNNLVQRLVVVLEEESTESYEETFSDEESRDSKDDKE